MKVFKYFIVALFLLNLPSVTLVAISPVISNLLSVLSFLSLVAYYLFVEKSKLNGSMIVLGLFYFSISSLSGQDFLPEENRFYYAFIIKYFILVICGNELIKRVTKNEMLIFLLIGAISIIFQILFFYNPLKDSGRYSGFYLNPNFMAFICTMGYSLTYGIANRKVRFISQIVFTVFGLLTFSRTFLLLWLLINLISLKINFKNIKVFAIGLGAILLMLTYNEFLPVKNKRIEQLNDILSGNSIKSSELAEDSRTETWSTYYDAIAEKPFWGSGFDSFNGIYKVRVGVHNTYLKILGESGFIPLIIFITIYGLMLRRSFTYFNKDPDIFLLSVSIVLFLTTFHNYFDTGYILLISMWIQARIQQLRNNDSQLELSLMNHPLN